MSVWRECEKKSRPGCQLHKCLQDGHRHLHPQLWSTSSRWGQRGTDRKALWNSVHIQNQKRVRNHNFMPHKLDDYQLNVAWKISVNQSEWYFTKYACCVSVLPAVSQMIMIEAALTLFCKCVEKLLCEHEYIPVYSNGTIVPSQSPQAKWLIQTVYYSSHAVLFLQLSKLGICREDFSNLINATEKKINKVYRTTPVLIFSKSHCDLFFSLPMFLVRGTKQ